MAKKKYYVVWVGKKPGIYSNWADCQAQTNHFDQAKFKSFESRDLAEKAYREGWQYHWGKGNTQKAAKGQSNRKTSSGRPSSFVSNEIDYNSISVDVGTRGNPGPVEYKGVDTRTGEVIFSNGPISKGTNNLGEFLAIVHALAYLNKLGSNKTVYTDSRNAMKWVKEKAVSTTLKRDASTAEIWELIDRALHWLHNHTYDNKVLKWDTKNWGEIKADYGRK
ncbi:ribonuclease H [Oceanobacillus zhaokaii]|uniref:Ribonuclease H n=1 Tax=Oceanobacillus zhaokaii TaxID=2052660 RepID=A0A345PIU7_9BACI|nr:ribonuclease H family protein [Oceanobacillus zhaokaii]AXI09927.1 ribonuclease H [Oceanobacillus zhaokaii]